MLKISYRENDCSVFWETTEVYSSFFLKYPVKVALFDFLSYSSNEFEISMRLFTNKLFSAKVADINDVCKDIYFDFFISNCSNIYVQLLSQQFTAIVKSIFVGKDIEVMDKDWAQYFSTFSDADREDILFTSPKEKQKEYEVLFGKVIYYEMDFQKLFEGMQSILKSELNLLAEFIKMDDYADLDPTQIMFAMDYYKVHNGLNNGLFYCDSQFTTTVMYHSGDKKSPMPDIFNVSIEEVLELAKIHDTRLIDMYEIYDIENLGKLDIMKIIESKTLVKKCERCLHYFVPEGRVDTKYCNRESRTGGKTCSEIGSIEKYREKTANNPILKEFNKIYKRNSSRVSNKNMTKQQFYEWSELAREGRDKCLNGDITIEELLVVLGK